MEINSNATEIYLKDQREQFMQVISELLLPSLQLDKCLGCAHKGHG